VVLAVQKDEYCDKRAKKWAADPKTKRRWLRQRLNKISMKRVGEQKERESKTGTACGAWKGNEKLCDVLEVRRLTSVNVEGAEQTLRRLAKPRNSRIQRHHCTPETQRFSATTCEQDGKAF